MKKILAVSVLLSVLFSSCQPADQNNVRDEEGRRENSVTAALCDFAPVDSVSAQAWLKGEWELAGVQTNYMGTKPDEFLTGEQIGTPKALSFYTGNQFAVRQNGQPEGERQAFMLNGQSLAPLAYQFWFCGENTLVLSNQAADGPVEVYIRK